MADEGMTLAKLHGQGVRVQVEGQASAEDLGCSGLAAARALQGVRLMLHSSTAYDGYANAQLDDYRVDRRNEFRWRANVEMTVRARFSHGADAMTGTAGFGFWNAPVGIGVRSLPKLPAAAWFFFAGPNSNIAAVQGVPGHGWKAASMDASNAAFVALLPAVPVAMPLMRVRTLYRMLWPVAQGVMRADECILPHHMDEWHEYKLTWTRESVRYLIDGQVVHVCDNPPRARMGFAAWIDNQYMVATPQGEFGQGSVAVGRARSLELADLRLRAL